MSKKSILILSPFFFPEPISTGKYNTDFTRELVKKGHQVKVLAFHPFYPEWKINESNDTIEGVKIIRGGKWIRFPKNQTIRRFILEFFYAFFVLIKINKHKKGIDVIIPVFPPSLMYYLITPFLGAKMKKIGMVHDLQEIYANKPGLLNSFVKRMINKVEKRCYQSCDKLIFLSDEMKQVGMSLYELENEKCETQFPFFTLTDRVTNDLGYIFEGSEINIVYSGALGEKQNPHKLYDAYLYCSERIKNCHFHFFSQGDVFEELKNKNSSKKIFFHDLVPRENIEELYSRSSIQLLPQKENTSKGSLPSKLPNILVSGCKILVITDLNSDIQKLFNSFNFEKVINSWDNQLIYKSILNLLDSNNKREEQKTIARELFNIKSLVNKIVD